MGQINASSHRIRALTAGLLVLALGPLPAAAGDATRSRPPARNKTSSLSVDRLVKILSANAPKPFASRFSKEFLGQQTLKDVWTSYRRFQAQGAPAPDAAASPDAERLLVELRGHPEFKSLIQRFINDPGFRETASRLGREPEVQRLVRDQLAAMNSSSAKTVAAGAVQSTAAAGGSAHEVRRELGAVASVDREHDYGWKSSVYAKLTPEEKQRIDRACFGDERQQSFWDCCALAGISRCESLCRGAACGDPPSNPPAGPPTRQSAAFDWTAHNERRSELLGHGDERGACQQMDIILRNSLMDGYMLQILSSWELEKNKAKAIANLKASRCNDFPHAAAAATIKQAQLHAELGDTAEAEELYRRMASMNDPRLSLAGYRALAVAELQHLASKAPAFDWAYHNELRHQLFGKGDERGSFGQIDIILQHSIMDSYMLNILSRWELGRSREKALANLGAAAGQYRGFFPFVEAACHIQMGDLLAEAGRLDEAAKHYEEILDGSNLGSPEGRMRVKLPPDEDVTDMVLRPQGRVELTGAPSLSPSPYRMATLEKYQYLAKVRLAKLPGRRQQGAKVVRALHLIYDPILSDGRKLSQARGWQNPRDLVGRVVESLRRSSNGYLDYQIVQTLELNEWPRKTDSFRYTEETYSRCMDSQNRQRDCHSPDDADYAQVWRDQNLCKPVAAGKVDEVFIYAFPYAGFDEFAYKIPGDRLPYKRPTNPWLYDLRTKNIPDCNGKTVWVMGWNYERGVAEAVHSFGHRVESALSITVGRGDWTGCSGRTDWDMFTCTAKDVTGSTSQTIAGCGNVHVPPNGQDGYDYANHRVTPNICASFNDYPRPAAEPARNENCAAWGCDGDAQLQYLEWWLRRLPRTPGRNLSGDLADWWRYVADFDNAVREAETTGPDHVDKICVQEGAAPDCPQGTRAVPDVKTCRFVCR